MRCGDYSHLACAHLARKTQHKINMSISKYYTHTHNAATTTPTKTLRNRDASHGVGVRCGSRVFAASCAAITRLINDASSVAIPHITITYSMHARTPPPQVRRARENARLSHHDSRALTQQRQQSLLRRCGAIVVRLTRRLR